MKKFILKLLTNVVYYSGCFGLGFVLGRLASLLFNKIVSAEMAENHPVVTMALVAAIVMLVLCAPAIGLVYVMAILKVNVEDKIDDADWD